MSATEPHPRSGREAVDSESAPFQPEGEAPDSTVTPVEERIARAFHNAYEALAPSFDYKTRDASAVEWPDVPESNRDLMCAVVRQLLDAGIVGALDAQALALAVWNVVDDYFPDRSSLFIDQDETRDPEALVVDLLDAVFGVTALGAIA